MKDLFTSPSYRCGSFIVQPDLGLVSVGETSVRLTPVHMRTLCALVAGAPEMISRQDLFKLVWGEQVVSDDTLTRAISDVRTSLAQLASDVQCIETIPKRGYRWLIPLAPHPPDNGTAREVEKLVPIDLPRSSPAEPVGHHRQNTGAVFWRSVRMILLSVTISAALTAVLTWYVFNLQVNPRLALIPINADHASYQSIATELNDRLYSKLVRLKNVSVFSQSTHEILPLEGDTLAASHQRYSANLFHYLHREYGAKWIIEGRMRTSEGRLRVVLSLVEARTALVSQTATFTLDINKPELEKVAEEFMVTIATEI